MVVRASCASMTAFISRLLLGKRIAVVTLLGVGLVLLGVVEAFRAHR
jgi:uncharacterized membrane protein